MKNKIIIVSGDPNSINSEIIFKSWKKLNSSIKRKIYLISNFDLLTKQKKKLKFSTKLIKVKSIEEQTETNSLKVLDFKLKFKDPFNVKKKESSNFIIECLNYAHKISLQNNIMGLINCGIDKKLLKRKNTGVTEYLASKCNIKNKSEVMLIKSDHLSVSPITTHIDLKNVHKKISVKAIINKLKTINSWFRLNIKKKPRIGVLGLNPHNAELRKKSEEVKIIVPAIKKAKKLGMKVNGPLVSDTLFINDYKNYDVIIGMYHDQIITPFKTIFKFNAINLTLGLKYLRVSPDHGTATNLIGKNKANDESLTQCIYFINKFGK